MLIYATGFEVQKTGIYNQIVGEDGVELNEKYADGIRTLLGIHTARLSRTCSSWAATRRRSSST